MIKLILLCTILGFFLYGLPSLADDDVDAESLKALEGMEQVAQKMTPQQVEEVSRTLTPDQQNQVREMAGKLEQDMNSNARDSRY